MLRLAVIDDDTIRRQAIAPQLRGAVVVSDGRQPCDAVAYLSAPAGGLGEVEQTLAGGAHVLLSTNIGMPWDAARTLTQRAEASPGRLTWGNPDRYLPSRQLIRQQLDAGKLGPPGLIRIHRWSPLDLLLCDLDLVQWYFGKPANLVYAFENAGCTQAHLGFAGGGMALIDAARGLPAGDRYYSLSLIGASGAAHADDHANTQLLYQGGAPRALRVDEGVTSWTALLQAFVDSLRNDAPAQSTADWHAVWNTAAAVAQALQTGQSIIPDGAA